MQYRFSLTPAASRAIEASLSQARLRKYIGETHGDLDRAIQLYHWNCRLCGAFYPPINVAEVTIRNAISIPLKKRFGADWHRSSKLRNILNETRRSELKAATDREERQHGPNTTASHVISGLNFGFWVGLMARPYDKHLWANGIKSSFPAAPKGFDRATIHQKIDAVRQIRNDVMHLRSIFDKQPRKRLAEITAAVALICEDTAFFLRITSEVEQIIAQKPGP